MSIARAIAGVAVAGIAVVGTGAMDDNTTRNANGEITEAGGLGVFEARVGDCFNMPEDQSGSDLVISMEGVPCATLHEFEVFHLFDLPTVNADGPVNTTNMNPLIDQGCYDAFDSYVGADYYDSRYDFSSMVPTAEGWAAGDHGVTCILFDQAGTSLGSARGTAR